MSSIYLYHLSHYFSHKRLCLVCGYLNLFMAYFNRCVFKTEIGNNAYSKSLYSTMVCNNNFRNCAHSNSITTKSVLHFILGRSLKRRTLNSYINTMNHANAFFFSYFICLGNKSFVVCLVHIGETWTGREIFATQRMFRK